MDRNSTTKFFKIKLNFFVLLYFWNNKEMSVSIPALWNKLQPNGKPVLDYRPVNPTNYFVGGTRNLS